MQPLQHRSSASTLLLVFLLASLCLPGLLQAQTMRSATFPMPSVVGLNIKEADARVLEAGRISGATSARGEVVERRYDNQPAGRIIRQVQATGTPMRPYMDDVGGVYGRVTYQVVLSLGPRPPTTFPMPDVVGMTVPQAQEAVVAAGQRVKTTRARAVVTGEAADDRPAGVIIRQLEPPGSQMRPYGDDVGGVYGEVEFRVVLSAGRLLAPDFLGKPLRLVMREARRRELQLEVGAARRDPGVQQGIVIGQDPEPGAPMRGRNITVYPSDGYPLPDYVGRPAIDAERDARKLAFALEATEAPNRFMAPGIIFEQYPAADTRLPLEAPVRISISRGWPVPDLVGKDRSDASQIARELELRLRASEQDNPRVASGLIVSQDPQPGSLIPRDRVISVQVSRGYPLPDLVGKNESEAQQVASRLGFRLEVTWEQLPQRVAGAIDRQAPAPGTRLPLDEPVRVTVSEGWPTIPDFVGKTLADARREAKDSRIVLLEAGAREDFVMTAGLVLEQAPAAGGTLPPDRRVEVVLSGGWPVAPDAVGKPLRQVRGKFLASYPGARIELTENPLSLEAEGTVIAQSPDPGVKLDREKRLALTVVSARPVWLWPAVGTFVVAAVFGAIRLLRPGTTTARGEALQKTDTRGIRLRVTKDPGLQVAEGDMKSGADPGSGDSAVEIRVRVDLGEQSVGPIRDEGG